MRRHPRASAAVVLAIVGLAAFGLGLGLGAWSSVCRTCPSTAQIYVWEPKQATRILAADGGLIAELGGGERRTPVAIEQLPRHVPLAFVAVEDRRFYEHAGFSLRGILRAALVRAPGMGAVLNRRAGGGSTITQQLARHMFEQQIGFEVRLSRKLKELRVARELERVYTKDQILEAYINQINYGRGHHGIASAAEWMFGKPASELDPAEAALLAAVINRPEYYSPFSHPERALARRNLVLRLMAEQGIIEEASLEKWLEAPLPAEPHGPGEGTVAPYFVEWVRGMLDDRYGSDLYGGGYRIHTTLDLQVQRSAREAMETGWEAVESRPGYRHPTYAQVVGEEGGTTGGESRYLQGLLIAMDPVTGAVRALIGGRDFDDSKFNRATQARRQPGSVFKPIVYTAAIASGIPASTIVYDAPILLEQPGAAPWSPRNYDGDYHGPMTMREGLRRSINMVAVKIGLEVGVETVAQFAQRLGISTPIPRVPSITIGAADVIPLDMLQAYSALATEGIRTTPHAVVRVEDSEGRVLLETQPERTQVVDTLVAAIMRDMLADVVNHGTAYSARDPARGNLPYDIPAAGKTGTTNDATDTWFVGFTPDLLTAIWFGFDRPARIYPGADGGRVAAPVFGSFMRALYVGDDAVLDTPAPWSVPAALTTRQVDKQSGQLATEFCPEESVYTELYIPGTEPGELCELHVRGLLGRPLHGPADTLADSLRIRRRF